MKKAIMILMLSGSAAMAQTYTLEKNGIVTTSNLPGVGDFHKVNKATLNTKTGTLTVLADRAPQLV